MEEPNNTEFKNNPFCTSTFKYYIKYGNDSCNFVGKYNLKPIEYKAFFMSKYFSAVIASSVVPIFDNKSSDNAYSAIYKSVMKNIKKKN